MDKVVFYDALRQYKESRKITLPMSRPERKRVIRVAKNFILKGTEWESALSIISYDKCNICMLLCKLILQLRILM